MATDFEKSGTDIITLSASVIRSLLVIFHSTRKSEDAFGIGKYPVRNVCGRKKALVRTGAVDDAKTTSETGVIKKHR